MPNPHCTHAFHNVIVSFIKSGYIVLAIYIISIFPLLPGVYAELFCFAHAENRKILAFCEGSKN